MEIRITGSKTEYEKLLTALDRVVEYEIGGNSNKKDPERFSIYLYNIKLKNSDF